MKKIKALVISQLPWSNSNRGIDILTEALSEIKGVEVHHLVFPRSFDFLMRVKENHPKIKQHFAKKQYLFYYDKLMWWLPKKIIKLIIEHMKKSVSHFNFKNYDIIILESGNPTVLIDLIPKNKILIYRQSDSMKYSLNKNPLLWEFEERTMDQANIIIVVNQLLKDKIPNKYKNKTKMIINGFKIPKNYIKKNPFPPNSKNVVYLGLAPIDFTTIKYLIQKNPLVNFHIIGRGLSFLERISLKKYKNFKYYGIMNPKQYIPFIKYCDVFIVPYKNTPLVRLSGLTSKYLLAIYFQKPIISYKVGLMNEFKGLSVNFVNNKEEFDLALKRTLKTLKRVKYNLNIDFYSYEGRKKEYITLFKDIIKNNFYS